MPKPGSRRKRNLLSVDFDFFFPMDHSDQLMDWGHAENGLFMGPILWQIRAAAFLQHGRDLPRCEGLEGFWQRFRFAPGTVLFYADSHSQAAHPAVHLGVNGLVTNLDAHHDLGYDPNALERLRKDGLVDCANWLLFYQDLLGLPTRVILPTWMNDIQDEQARGREVGAEVIRDDGSGLAEEYSRIFVARSGAWTPSWCDDQFQALIDSCPVGTKVDMDEMAGYPPLVPREFDRALAEAHAAEWRAQVESRKVS